jgi:transcriptional regulator with XRE-family HTH domain
MSKDKYTARKVLAFQVRQTRHMKRYSQEVLAELSGLNRSYIGAVERAEHNIGIDNVEKIANGLEVPIKRLIDSYDPDVVSDCVRQPDVSTIEPIIRTTQFLELVKQCAGDRPDLLVIYLERCGCRFIHSK